MTDDLLELAIATTREAAAFVTEQRPPGRVRTARTKSSATDPVTEVDTATEQLIRDRILAARPDDGFIGEEGRDHSGSSGVDWVVDPIDGTVNFVYGIPAYAVSIAARVEGDVQVGCVVDVVSGREYTATHSGGAYVREGGQPPRELRLEDPPPLAEALVATGFGYDPHRRGEQGSAVAALLPRVRDIRRFGAASLDLCAVAAGIVDAYVEEGLQPWDLAAGGLVAREAGARVGGLHGAEAGERLVIATHPQLFPDLHEAVAESGF